MATYLLTWNPKQYEWEDLEDEAQQTAEGTPVIGNWSCGVTKRIEPDDRVFLLRQGKEPKGIVGAGWAISSPYKDRHWDPPRAAQGMLTLYVDVEFERLLYPEVDRPLPLSLLKNGELERVNWSTQASGIEIKEGTDDLERLWRGHLSRVASSDFISQESEAYEGAVVLALRRHRARERWLRDAKLDAVKRANGGRLPCEYCGFDFLDAYGEIGRDYAQVHHTKPLNDRTRPSRTRLRDLEVVCANCHVMIHRGGMLRKLIRLIKS